MTGIGCEPEARCAPKPRVGRSLDEHHLHEVSDRSQARDGARRTKPFARSSRCDARGA
jgi:hypothetical protein